MARNAALQPVAVHLQNYIQSFGPRLNLFCGLDDSVFDVIDITGEDGGTLLDVVTILQENPRNWLGHSNFDEIIDPDGEAPLVRDFDGSTATASVFAHNLRKKIGKSKLGGDQFNKSGVNKLEKRMEQLKRVILLRRDRDAANFFFGTTLFDQNANGVPGVASPWTTYAVGAVPNANSAAFSNVAATPLVQFVTVARIIKQSNYGHPATHLLLGADTAFHLRKHPDIIGLVGDTTAGLIELREGKQRVATTDAMLRAVQMVLADEGVNVDVRIVSTRYDSANAGQSESEIIASTGGGVYVEGSQNYWMGILSNSGSVFDGTQVEVESPVAGIEVRRRYRYDLSSFEYSNLWESEDSKQVNYEYGWMGGFRHLRGAAGVHVTGAGA